MKQTSSDGSTLMETLVTIAVILTLSGCIMIAFSSGTRANFKSVNAIRTANLILETDRFIRARADSLHVPYWIKPEESIEEFKNELRRSRLGMYIREITTLYDTKGVPRGITAVYEIGSKTVKTTALFPFLAVMDGRK